jgi:hypothetical protein
LCIQVLYVPRFKLRKKLRQGAGVAWAKAFFIQQNIHPTFCIVFFEFMIQEKSENGVINHLKA